MVDLLEVVKYKFDEQKRGYSEIVIGYSDEQKMSLAEKLLEEDLWAYLQLIIEILYDIAKSDEKYLNLLEKVYLKVRNDLASGPFFNMLVDLGQSKKDIGIRIYNKIQEKNNNEGLKDISGLILGGYSTSDNSILKKLIDAKQLEYPLTNLTLKAIMVKSERLSGCSNKDFVKEKNKYNLSKEEYAFLDMVSQSEDERFLKELMNMFLFIYWINPSYFYNKIDELMKKNKSRISEMIWIKREKLGLKNEQLLYFAELTKDCDEYALHEVISSLVFYKEKYCREEIKEICNLLIYWINKDMDFKIRDFYWFIEEFGKRDSQFVEYFLVNYNLLNRIDKPLKYYHLFPRVFESLIKHSVNESIQQLLASNLMEREPKLFCQLSEIVIGEIYSLKDKTNSLKLFVPLANKIQEIAEQEPFININKDSYKKYILDNNFDEVINYIKELLEQIIFRNRKFDFKEIYTNISKFKKISLFSIEKLKELEKNKRYSSLFWLGSQDRDKELKQAYLNEIENFLIKSEKLANEKNKGDNTREFLLGLDDESKFWNNLSEILFSNKFIGNYSSIIEPFIPNKKNNADLLVNLNNKKMFFEITNPKMNRNVHLDNGAVTVRNKLKDAIRDKAQQYYSTETLDEISESKRSDLFFIVVDGDSSFIDEHMIEECFYGSLAVQFYRNPQTGTTTEPETIRINNAIMEKKEWISGLIYFKKQLANIAGEIKFIFLGDIIANQNAINKITSEDYKKLKKIIFS